jgi:hypothetical protein
MKKPLYVLSIPSYRDKLSKVAMAEDGENRMAKLLTTILERELAALEPRPSGSVTWCDKMLFWCSQL